MLNKTVTQFDDKWYLITEVLNARQIRISTNYPKIIIEETDGDISSVTIGENYKFKLHKTIKVVVNKQTLNYYIYSITKLSSNSILISTNYPTKTKHFILPTLGHNKERFQTDSFLEDVKLDETFKYIYLNYRYIEGDLYNLTESFLIKNPLFVNHIDIDNEHVLYKFKIPKEFWADVKLFIEGRYSRFSKELKTQILLFYGLTSSGDTYKILYKDSKRREQLELELGCDISADIELFTIPDLEKEVMTI